MAQQAENELIGKLQELVEVWTASQRNDGISRPLVGSRRISPIGVETYVIFAKPSPRFLPPRHPVRCSLSTIEELVRMGYLRPENATGAYTYLHPTAEALFLADPKTRMGFRMTFHRRYQRLRVRGE